MLYLPQSGYNFPDKIFNIQGFDVFAYNAGVSGIYTVNLSAETNITPGTEYFIQIISGDGTYNSGRILVYATGSTTTQLAIDTGNALNGSAQSGIFTYSVSGSTVTINEATPTTQGFTIIWSDTLGVVGTSTPNQPSVGSLAQAQAYNPNITSGTYTICRWTLFSKVSQQMLAGSSTETKSYIDILLNSGASGYAQALAQIMSYGNGFPAMPSTYSASFLANLVGTNP